MIVAAIDIENYKQYAGTHRIEFPDQGIVSITGPNGAGKTTLFEAIEWCLYCPRSIPQSSVPPHDGIGRTTVRVTLEDSNDGKRYCVQRELRSSGTQAEIYLEDDPGQPLVQGTREVTRYVARHLVGLPHGAFVSTFFTKQRELQFFGDRSATERRIEIGKLLGLEAVREAQSDIGEGRSTARSIADARLGEYERRLGTRVLDAEELTVAHDVVEAESREADAELAARQASEQADQSREVLDNLRDLQARDAALGHTLAQLGGELATATARRDGAAAELKRLELRAAERMELAAAAEPVDRLADRVRDFEIAREQSRLLQGLENRRRDAVDAETAVAERARQLVAENREAAGCLSGWEWTSRDDEECEAGTTRLQEIALSLDPDAKRAILELKQAAWQQSNIVGEIAVQIARYRNQRDKLTRERDDLLSSGEPDRAVVDAQRAMRELRDAEQKTRMSLAAARTQRTEVEELANSLREHSQDPICPTCSRALGEVEASRLIEVIEARIGGLIADEQILADSAHEAARLVASGEEAESAARARLDAVRSLEARLADGALLIADAEAAHRDASDTLQAALASIGATSVPTSLEIEQARLVAHRAQTVAGLTGLLERLCHEATAAHGTQRETQKAIREIGDVAFDEIAFASAVDALRSARHAAAQIERIDIELANLGQYQQQQSLEEKEIARLNEQSAAVSGERAALAFEPEQLNAAQSAERADRIAAVETRDNLASARQAVREALAARERLLNDHRQLLDLLEEADSRAREADELSRMYDEFSDFDRYVARHVGPLLADTTERMMSQVTNGKFDHVVFDENYGIDVFDGDEAFPIETFSGGERDVVALCARLALSEVVGSAAVRPPRFLVLDEVFGSLDGERRSQLLETLGGLAHAGHFRQMFIISHVDDVQQSPVMTEAWTIEERDGVSRVVRPEHFGASS